MRIRLSSMVLLALLASAALAGPAAGQSKEKGGANGSYVPIDTLTATVMSPGRRQVMTVQAGVDCSNMALHDYAAKVTPRLRDAYAQVLQLYASGMPPGAPPDADYVARRLQETTDRVLGKPGGKFLLGGIMVN